MIDLGDTSGYPQAGEIIDDKYRIERLLGAGGMGAVVEATHLLRRAPVALKFMSARLVHDPAVVERFLNEGVAASRINNEHVVSVLDVSKLANGQPYLVMEYLEGRDLAKLLLSEGIPGLVEIPRCIHFVLQVLRGLQVAHAAGIIHRDLKPANCLVVERDGEPDFLKIVDFGISKVKSESLNLTKVGSALGTPLYVSPEQARDPASVDARGDLYSVSTILYELLVGRTPFHPASGQLSELFMALATKEPQSLDTIRGDLPPGLDAAIRIGLSKSPDGRYRSAPEMAAALAPFSDARSERVLRQMLQRSTVRPSGSPAPSPFGSAPPSPQGSAPPLESAGPPPTRTSLGAPSIGAPTERVATPAGLKGTPAGHSVASPPTEKLGARASSGSSGAAWAAGAASDTAAPTTSPTFFRRRQTELKIAIPVLAALALAAVLFKTLRSSHSPSAEPSAPAAAAGPKLEAPPELPVPAAPATPAPTIRVIPGPSPLPAPAAPEASAAAPGTAAPPTVAPAEPREGVHPPAQPAPAPHAAPVKRRRPSLKQIGISE